MPKLEMTQALIGCFATCTAYALLLSTRRGMWMTLHLTWLTVVVGCGIVLLFVALVDAEAARLAAWMFAAGGFPIVVRSLWLTAANLWALLQYRISERGGE